MKISEIIKFPSTMHINNQSVIRMEGLRESCFRAYHTLNKVKDLLEKGTPPGVVLEIVQEIQDAKGVEKGL